MYSNDLNKTVFFLFTLLHSNLFPVVLKVSRP